MFALFLIIIFSLSDAITSTNNEYYLSNRSARDKYYANDYYTPMNNNHNHHHHSNVISPNGNNQIINNTMNNTNKFINNNALDNRPSNSHDASNGAISLINNIFSIYKPKKYSPLSCRSGAVAKTQKMSISKSMNVPSTVRPLGAPYNDFLTSLKRPLTIAPSCFTTQKRNWSIPSSGSVDQAHFKIIPEKTGLKISPLYRFGYEDDSKLRLKCTARPLLFPI